MQLGSALPEQLRNSRAVEVLERSLSRNRLGHGILLHGESMESLEQIVRAIAAHLLETERDPYDHPDCFTLRPSGKARMIRIGADSERVQGEWPRNSMRRLVLDIQKTSNQGGRKVGILFDADRMNVQSANAFLKTLEEPPAGTTLFLLTTRPYDLLDTIRSRCLNFRVPTASEGIVHPDWNQWATDYRNWLGMLLKGPNRDSVPHIMLASYGLNTRFQAILDSLTKAAWNQQKESLPENVTAEEKDAMEAGMSKGYRKQLFGEIEKLTAGFARDIEKLNPGRLPVHALHRVTAVLEHCTGLLEVNFNQAAALELFFLKSLRIWTAAR
ncbi:DNA polymerase III gamma/tau subunits-like protein [Coraliomargarita akajimensis]|uniref:DNA polymerase III gamma/tau subunits-like protein n=1 Tax=Coraliomargarita akajimensis (strain DSM 45221 / IAM 15411 / JCM 23193 / KCTC 12865 / 04OKA010-24) TaxID=583355 RepID=D5EQG1_CORAD|nr:DNA polymerase III gamma/tau subunits-like protein [Coraliomargarita akajimensis]ADE55775.1 DNA polymerase III gamma/tau subunits-like protein [Coraliomargarita akajimensis DSM 45221]